VPRILEAGFDGQIIVVVDVGFAVDANYILNLFQHCLTLYIEAINVTNAWCACNQQCHHTWRACILLLTVLGVWAPRVAFALH
jgi:hypothetical protein